MSTPLRSTPTGVTDVKEVLRKFGLLPKLFHLKPGSEIVSADLTLFHLESSFPPDDRPLIPFFFHLDDIHRTDDHTVSAGNTVHCLSLKRRNNLPSVSPKDKLDAVGSS